MANPGEIGCDAMAETTPSNALSFDYVVVGGGSAGCTIASRLSESGEHTVCLLEAGDSHTSPLITVPFNVALTISRALKTGISRPPHRKALMAGRAFNQGVRHLEALPRSME